MENIFEKFDSGKLLLPQSETRFAELEWHAHPTFEGVWLKHIVTSETTGGEFSCHLVRVEPGRKIGVHAHEKQLEIHEVVGGSGVCVNGGAALDYAPGVVSIMRAGMLHKVTAGVDGLYLFAKFIPALC
ncbi:MAG: hypothetical protein NC192_12645 [Muribaculaceae bacterium]|nr:hypothetical protein [Muribaculaceae bacterium]